MSSPSPIAKALAYPKLARRQLDRLDWEAGIFDRIETPKVFWPLYRPSRYKALFGGRSGGKSHYFAEKLVELCFLKTTRAVCIREVQLSLKESVRQLIVDKIEAFGLTKLFEVLEAEIRGPNDSLIIFRGMQSYNADTIKSLEGYDIAWVEEAQTLSADSLRVLRPTIRKPGSEIWFSWNPRHETDAVDRFFRGGAIPEDWVVVAVNWWDNPFLPQVMRDEMEHDRIADPVVAANVWDGTYESITEGAYYAREIAAAESEGRIGSYPYDPSLPVKTAWDIGVHDYTAIWFCQENGHQVRVIDYYEASGVGAEQIIEDALPELMPDQRKRTEGLIRLGRAPYKYAAHYLPHDAAVREWGAGARARVQTLIGLGMKAETMHIGVAADPADRINAVRRLMPAMHFNKGADPDAGVSLGLSRLRKYSKRFNRSLGAYTGPLHDESSHPADALGEYAINCSIVPKPAEKPAGTPVDTPRGIRILKPPPKPMSEMSYDEMYGKIGSRTPPRRDRV